MVREKSHKYHLMPCLEEQSLPFVWEEGKERFYDVLLVFKKYPSESGGGSTHFNPSTQEAQAGASLSPRPA